MCAEQLDKLNLIAYNVGSLVSHTKRIEFNNFVKLHQPDFLLLSETHLNQRHKFSIDQYKVIRNDRSDTNTGTAIFFKHFFQAENLYITGLISLEVTMIKINLGNAESLLIISVYNKCQATVNNIKHDLDLLLPVINNHTFTIMGGDFNARHVLWNDTVNSSPGTALVDWLNVHSVDHNLCIISQPFPTYQRSGSTLDFFLVSSNLINILPQISNYTCNTLDSDSDHLAIQLKINLRFQIFLTPNPTEHRLNLKKVNWVSFKNAVSNSLSINPVNSSRNLSIAEIDSVIELWQQSVVNALNQLATPSISHYKYQDLPPLLSKLYKFRSCTRKKLNRILRQNNYIVNPQYRLILSQINCLSTIIKQQTSIFINDQFRNRLKKIKPGPNTFNSIYKIIGKKIPIPDVIYSNSVPIHNLSDKVEAFATRFENNFNPNPPNHLPEFLSVVNSSVESLQRTPQSITEFSTTNTSEDPLDKETFIDSDFVINTIVKSNNKKSCGPDGISSYVLKKLPVAAVVLLTIIFNNCINLSYFPSAWKKSVILPVPKKISASNLTDFHPIALLNSVSKVFERVILHKINIFCDDRNISQNIQFGFKKGHGTLHSLLKFHADVTLNLNKKETTAACFLDIEKAFDSIWTNGLIFKLLNLGFPGAFCKLILHYLSNRKFSVKINTQESTSKNVNAGVPQGSVLGPNLFNLYLHDQPVNDFSTTSLLYADDSLTYASSMNPAYALNKVKVHIAKLFVFYQRCGMKVNCNKSEILFIRRPVTSSSRGAPATACRNLSITINGDCITSKRRARYLGVHFSELFKFNQHVNGIISKANFAFHLIHPLLKIRLGLPTDTKLLLYKQLIRPILTYGFPVWFTTSKRYMEKLGRIERKILRTCTGVYRKPDSHLYFSNKVLYEKARILPIDCYLMELANRSLSKLSNHPNSLINGLSALELHTSMRYLHCTSLTVPAFQQYFYTGERLIFYEISDNNFHRG